MVFLQLVCSSRFIMLNFELWAILEWFWELDYPWWDWKSCINCCRNRSRRHFAFKALHNQVRSHRLWSRVMIQQDDGMQRVQEKAFPARCTMHNCNWLLRRLTSIQKAVTLVSLGDLLSSAILSIHTLFVVTWFFLNILHPNPDQYLFLQTKAGLMSKTKDQVLLIFY